MKILLTGATGGIGSAIKESLATHGVTCFDPRDYMPFTESFDWVIFAHGVIDEEFEDKTLWANTVVPMWITKDILPYLEYGVIYISSTAGINGNDKFPVYAASKAAINNYVKSMARGNPQHSFYALCPGPTDTPGWRKLKITDIQPQSPKEVAKAVKEIMDGKYKSGDIITVRDGVISV